jgi:hypothetical protein
MTTQRVFIFVMVMIALVGLLWIGNTYLLEPALKPVLPVVQPLPPAGGEQPPVDSNIVAATMNKIRAAAGEGPPSEFEPRRVDRNPFLWPGETAEIKPQDTVGAGNGEKVVEAPIDAIVRMILIGQHKKMAVINDQIVFEGGDFLGRTVASIEKKSVVLSGMSGEQRLPLQEMSYSYMKDRSGGEREGSTGPQGVDEVTGMPPAGLMGTSSKAQQEAVHKLMERLAPLLEGTPQP